MSNSIILFVLPYGEIGNIGVLSEMGKFFALPYTAALEGIINCAFGQCILIYSRTEVVVDTELSISLIGLIIESGTDDEDAK